MANELVFDVVECLRASSSRLVDGIENACLNREAGLGARALHGLQGGAGRIEYDAA